MSDSALRVEGLSVAYGGRDGRLRTVVSDLDLDLRQGRLMGLAGESGCGKSTAALAAIGYVAPRARTLTGTSMLGDLDLLAQPRSRLRSIWGKRVTYVTQDAAGALNPLHKVGAQVAEPLELHMGLHGSAARERAVELLERMGIPNAAAAADRYPFQFSGGQQQRIALAAAMACEPEVLVLDEPTTGLDVTTQERISELIMEQVANTGTAALHISHDLALLAESCDEIAIMYAGEIVERGSAARLLSAPRHPYTAALLKAVPRVDSRSAVVGIPGLPPATVIEGSCSFAPRCEFAIDRCAALAPPLEPVEHAHDVRCIRAAELGVLESTSGAIAIPAAADDTGAAPLLSVDRLVCAYKDRHSHETVAVADVSLSLAAGDTVGVVGESGSGKSTLLRAIAGLHPPRSGELRYRDEPLKARAIDRSRVTLRDIQIVFQDPNASLNPRHTVAATLQRPLRLFEPELSRSGRHERMLRLLDEVHLDPDVANRRPSELSGGQRQRVALARAFAASPRLILCDEVVSALDVSVQASILELLLELTRERGTAVLFVTHDLAVVRQIADRLCVMRAGRICEEGPAERLFADPQHEYTRSLLAAVPQLGPAATG